MAMAEYATQICLHFLYVGLRLPLRLPLQISLGQIQIRDLYIRIATTTNNSSCVLLLWYTLSFVMSLPPLYPETLGDGCTV